jgi:hypothetical protein
VFKPYASQPITRMAFQITNRMMIIKVGEAAYRLYAKPTTTESPTINFKAYEEPKVGDWIVRLTEEDTYHVTDAVFRERNIVPEA